jgi:DNA-binding MarR family transcriptional regulator
VGEKEGNNGRNAKYGSDRLTVDLLRELAASLDALTNAASPHTGLNRTDIRALDIINMQEGLTAGQLASRLKLTTGAITGVLDRLERAGRAQRTHDQDDRRRVVIQPTAEARQSGSVVFGELHGELDALLGRYTDRERDVIDNFLRSITDLMSERADELSHDLPPSEHHESARQRQQIGA